MPSTHIYHYVYRITNTVLHKHYYGKRSSKIAPNLDLGKKYFSSSKDKQFIQDQKENPEHYRYKIVKIFDNVQHALSLESKLHYKFDVGRNINFYNRAKQTLNGFDTTGKTTVKDKSGKYFVVDVTDLRYTSGELVGISSGVPISKDQREKISVTMKLRFLSGEIFTPEHRANLSKGSKGKPKSKEAIQKMLITKEKYDIQKGKDHPRSKYIYITPFGVFDSPEALEPHFTMSKMKNFCINCDKRVLPRVYRDCPQLQELFDNTCIGKTYRELGFTTRPSRI